MSDDIWNEIEAEGSESEVWGEIENENLKLDQPEKEKSFLEKAGDIGSTVLEGVKNHLMPDMDVARNVGISIAKGIISLPQAIQGLIDIPTGGRFGYLTKELGYDPEAAKAILDEFYTDAQKLANKEVDEAEGFFGTLKAMKDNPSTVVNAAAESAPLMLGGAGVGQAVLKGIPALGAVGAAALGEGAISAGMQAEQMREENETGLLTPKESAMAVGAGIGTGAFAIVGGRLANKLGFADIDTMLVNKGMPVKPANIAARIVGGGVSEGVFEELPQSVQEQMWMNAAQGKDLFEGVPEAGAQGMAVGALMGSGANVRPPVKINQKIIDAPSIDEAIDEFQKGPVQQGSPLTASASSPAVSDSPPTIEVGLEQELDQWGKEIAEATPNDIRELRNNVDLIREKYPQSFSEIEAMIDEREAQLFPEQQLRSRGEPVSPDSLKQMARYAELVNSEDPQPIVDSFTPEEAKQMLDALNSAAGDNPVVRQVLEAKISQPITPVQKPEAKPVKIKGYHTKIADSAGLQQRSDGMYIALDSPFQPDRGEVSEVEVDIEPQKIFDPNGLLEGTDRERSRKDFDSLAGEMQNNLRQSPTVSLNAPAKARTEILKKKGYAGEVGYIDGPEDGQRELVVFDRKSPKPAKQKPAPVSDPQKDVLHDEVVRFIVDGGKATPNALKKEFGIGYSRASMLLGEVKEEVDKTISEMVEKKADLPGAETVTSTVSDSGAEQVQEKKPAKKKTKYDDAVEHVQAGKDISIKAISEAVGVKEKRAGHMRKQMIKDGILKREDIPDIDPEVKAYFHVFDRMREQLNEGDVSKSSQNKKGETSPTVSTNTDWIRQDTVKKWNKSTGLNISLGKADVNTIFDKLEAGIPLTVKQSEKYAYLKEVADSQKQDDHKLVGYDTWKQVEAEGFDVHAPKTTNVGNLNKGDEVVVIDHRGNPDILTHKGRDDSGDILLQDGVTMRVDEFDTIETVAEKTSEQPAEQPAEKPVEQPKEKPTKPAALTEDEISQLESLQKSKFRIIPNEKSEPVFQSLVAKGLAEFDGESYGPVQEVSNEEDAQPDRDTGAEPAREGTVRPQVQSKRELQPETEPVQPVGVEPVQQEVPAEEEGVQADRQGVEEKTTEQIKDAWRIPVQDILSMHREMLDLRKKNRKVQHEERYNKTESVDEKGNTIMHPSPRAKEASDAFYSLQRRFINLLNIKGTNYDKHRAVKYLDSQQVAERMSDKEITRRHKAAVKQALQQGKDVPQSILEDYPDLKPKKVEQPKPSTQEPMKRGKPKQAITFDPAIKGRSGSEAYWYDWAWTGGVRFDPREGGEVEARVSDWDEAVENPETGRKIVHKFHIKTPEGEYKTVSLETAQEVLGIKNILTKVRHERNRAFLRDLRDIRRRLYQEHTYQATRNGFPKTLWKNNAEARKAKDIYQRVSDLSKKKLVDIDRESFGEKLVTDREISILINKNGKELEKVYGEIRDMLGEKQPEQPKTKPSVSKPVIEDFGEKIGGARKDYATKLTEAEKLDIATVPLSKAWPEPNYTELADSSDDKLAIALARAMRDEVPAKPRVRHRIPAYTKTVEELRGFAAKLINGDITSARVIEQSKKNDISKIISRAELYVELGHDKSLKGYSFGKHHFALFHGRENVDVWTVEKRTKGPYGNIDTVAYGDTREEALEKFKTRMFLTPSEDTKKVKFKIYSYNRDPKTIWIGKGVGSNTIDLKSFSNAKEAREYRDNNYDELLALLEKKKYIPDSRRKANEERIGENYRKGKDVTPEEFTAAFGFRGVEFGNWVAKTDERQNALNNAYDALSDLAGILGIPTQAISLDGELGLAFGARGKGGSKPAAAHYEPGKVVINLTRKHGAGTLGHEWWHALDNYFSRKRNYPSQHLTERPIKLGEKDVTRQEMVDAFKGIMKAIGETDLRKRSARLDSKRSKKYWQTEAEMSARVFENYVITKLAEKGYSNDYLANIADESMYISDLADFIGEMAETDLTAMDLYPYLKEEEAEGVIKAFDHFFDTLETKQTDKGVALFSRRFASNDIKSITELSQALASEEVSSLIDERAEGLSDVFDRINSEVGEDAFASRFHKTANGVRTEISKYGFLEDEGKLTILDTQKDAEDLIAKIAGELEYSKRSKPAPKKTVKAYKLFKVKKSQPGKIFPLFVDANTPVEIGVWLDAEPGELTPKGKVKSKLGPLAYRPGWHAGDYPIATHIGTGGTPPVFRSEDQVWAEVEFAADVDWQAEANRRASRKKDGSIISRTAHITDQVPEDGFYRYKTNPNMTGNWLISGSMKVNRILSDTEVEEINNRGGVADLPRQESFAAAEYGLEIFYSTAYHGTPHRGIERFSTDKIGTGEGAQAYGWGLYFADKKEVAEWYREHLSRYKLTIDGKPVSVNSSVNEKMKDFGLTATEATILSRIANTVFHSPKMPRDIAEVREKFVSQVELYEPYKDEPAAEKAYIEAKSAVQLIDKLGMKFGISKGQLYKVEIPEDDVMLHWDKPLREQPEPVKKAIARLDKTLGVAPSDEFDDDEGWVVYRSLAGRFGNQYNAESREASQTLLRHGIKGIKYLDGSSRGNGEGSFNYVIFDGADTNIVETFYSKKPLIQGFTVNGKAYMVADGIEKGDAHSVLLHEVGVHLQKLALSDKDFQIIVDDVYSRKDAIVQRAMARAEDADTSPENMPEETLAYIIEDAPDSTFTRRIIARVKKILVQAFGKRFANMLNEKDLRALADIALRGARTRNQVKELKKSVKFSISKKVRDKAEKAYDKYNQEAVRHLSRLKKPDSSPIERIISSSEYIMHKYPASRKVIDLLTDRQYLRQQKENQILADFVPFMDEAKKNSPKEYQAAARYKVSVDRTGKRFGIRQKKGYRVYSPSGRVVGYGRTKQDAYRIAQEAHKLWKKVHPDEKRLIRDYEDEKGEWWQVYDRDGKNIGEFDSEQEAVNHSIKSEHEWLVEKGYSRKSADIVAKFREMTNRAFDISIEDLRRVQQEAEEMGLDEPFMEVIDESRRFGVYGGGKLLGTFWTEDDAVTAKKELARTWKRFGNLKIKEHTDDEIRKKLTISDAIALMSDLRGSYFPRTRDRGGVILRATKGKRKLLQKYDFYMPHRETVDEKGVVRTRPVAKAAKTAFNKLTGFFPSSAESDRKKLEAKGWNVQIDYDTSMPEDVFQVAQLASGVEAMMTEGLGRAKKKAGQESKVKAEEARKQLNETLKRLKKQIRQHEKDGLPTTGLVKTLEGVEAEIQNLGKTIEASEKAKAEEAAQFMNKLLTYSIGDIYKQRGFLYSRMKRSQEYWEGFETDPLIAGTQYARDLAAGMAKRETMQKAIKAMTGRDITWGDFKEENPDGTWEEYEHMVRKKRIDPKEQPHLYGETLSVLEESMRNEKQVDRVLGTIKGLAVHYFLGFRVSSAAVNATNMVIGVPPTISAHTGAGIVESLNAVRNAAVQYNRYLQDMRKVKNGNKPDSSISAEDRDIFVEIQERAWDAAQFNIENAAVLRSKLGRGWDQYAEHSMWMFGQVEKTNRATTIFAAYKMLRKHTALSKEEALQEARHISDRSHGIYGKPTLPGWARGAYNPLKLTYTFQKFQHNYVLNMYEQAAEGKYKQAAYMLFAPAVMAGLGATMATPLFKLLYQAGGGDDDPEEAVYDFVDQQVAELTGSDWAGDYASRIARHGIAGAAGVNLKGSIQMNNPFPTTLQELGGAPFSMVKNFWEGGAMLKEGEYLKGAEKLLPLAAGNVVKAGREYTEGVTTRSYSPVYFGEDPLRTDEFDAFLRMLSFNPSEISAKREKQWHEKSVKYRLDRRRYRIYSKIRQYTFYERGDWPEIEKEILHYNETVLGTGRNDITLISKKGIKSMLKRASKPNKTERLREK